VSFEVGKKRFSRRHIFLNNWMVEKFLAPLGKFGTLFSIQQLQPCYVLNQRDPKSYVHSCNIHNTNLLSSKELVFQLILKNLQSLNCSFNILLALFLIINGMNSFNRSSYDLIISKIIRTNKLRYSNIN